MNSLVAYDETSSDSDPDSSEKNESERDVQRTGSSAESMTSKVTNHPDRLQNKRGLSPKDSSYGEDELAIKKTALLKDHLEGDGKFKERDDSSDMKGQLNLPPAIQSMFNNKQTWIDNPAEHDFKVRSFPHVEGNWATHIFLPVSQDERFLLFIHQLLESFNTSQFHPMSDLHVSLSRTVVIRYHWINALVDSLRENLSCLKSCLADISTIKVFTNDEKTRTFLCLEVSAEDTNFIDYIEAIDKSFADFKLPAYYEDPSFHISIGWCLGDVRNRISNDTMSKAKEMLATFCSSNPELSIIFARQICCQSGNKIFRIPLQDSTSSR